MMYTYGSLLQPLTPVASELFPSEELVLEDGVLCSSERVLSLERTDVSLPDVEQIRSIPSLKEYKGDQG